MDERAKQFKTAAESNLSGAALQKEISTLRRFLFRNQEYRFTKAAQTNLFMAVTAHSVNPAARPQSDQESCDAQSPLLGLLEDALKMPLNVFSSAQKNKLLTVYWGLLGKQGEQLRAEGASGREKTLVLVDMNEVEQSLSLMEDSGEVYPSPVKVSDSAVLQEMKVLFDSGAEVRVTFRENSEDGLEFLHFEAAEE